MRSISARLFDELILTLNPAKSYHYPAVQMRDSIPLPVGETKIVSAVNDSPTANLCRGIARGDAEQFSRFFERWFDEMYAAARRASGRDEAFTLDVVQDAMMKVIAHIRPLPNEAELRAWLTVVVKRCAYDRLRAERRRTGRDARASQNRPGPEPADNDTQVRLDWLREELRQMLAEYRDVLFLRWRLGWTLERIGRALGLSTGAVDGRSRRAIEHLRSRAEELSDD